MKLDFLRKTVIIPWSTWKRDFLLLVNKLLELILYSLNAKEHYQSFIRNKNRTSKIITYQSKPFENLNIVNIKSVITEPQSILTKKRE